MPRWCKIVPLGHGQYVYDTANFTYYLVYRMYYSMFYSCAMWLLYTCDSEHSVLILSVRLTCLKDELT
jgi:uncharacterized protein (UPF0332 family)